MSELKRCGCGKVPKELHISENGQGGKYATCAGSCCGDWETEFRCDYAAIDSDECMAMAVDAWNALPREATIERQGQMIVKQAEELQDHERVMKMLRDRFPIREDGSHADYAVEDVLAENVRARELLAAVLEHGMDGELFDLIQELLGSKS